MERRGSSPYFNASYLAWLRHRIGMDDRYGDLLAYLNTIEFHSPIMMDRNRMKDALYLRTIYEDDGGVRFAPSDPGPSVLEFLVAMYDRTHETMGFDNGIFEMFLKNMGLDHCTTAWFDVHSDPEGYISTACDIMMDRRYRRDGKNGGLFVVRNPPVDMREAEWWWQMQYWISTQHIPDI